ncbi:MAG TPA: FAD-dependent oxidoreductase, partial [Verrucomicrobiae bacterium]|nr:FAD-dependent oxidoreductase [Verrucomicrobiae bacterium]
MATTTLPRTCDIAIVGGGIVGLATAWRLSESLPGQRVVVLEKEPELATHQTGRNSGVLHSGIYYAPGSLKAVNCRNGRAAMLEFCQREQIAHEVCGKVIVATREDELPRLENLFQRGRANGVHCEIIDRKRLGELEPHCRGIRAIHVPEAGIVNYRQVCERLATRVRERDGQIETGVQVSGIRAGEREVIVETSRGAIATGTIINCAGLHSDRMTALTGAKPPAKIIPFRG